MQSDSQTAAPYGSIYRLPLGRWYAVPRFNNRVPLPEEAYYSGYDDGGEIRTPAIEFDCLGLVVLGEEPIAEVGELEFDKLSATVIGHEGAVLANSIELDRLSIVIIGQEPL